MSFAKWIGASIGWSFGGPIGAIIGLAIGSMVDSSGIKPKGQRYLKRRSLEILKLAYLFYLL